MNIIGHMVQSKLERGRYSADPDRLHKKKSYNRISPSTQHAETIIQQDCP